MVSTLTESAHLYILRHLLLLSGGNLQRPNTDSQIMTGMSLQNKRVTEMGKRM